jgi:hypothetical protein
MKGIGVVNAFPKDEYPAAEMSKKIDFFTLKDRVLLSTVNS